MIPTRKQAKALLKDAKACNPGKWVKHSKVTAHSAKKIAEACGMDAKKAYVLGLLHDIGRKYCRRYIGHVYDGYTYMMSLGYDEAARICLTHSFQTQSLSDYVGKHDISQQELAHLEELLQTVEYDDYDRLIQLCDSISGSQGVMKIEERMNNVRKRYGTYPQEKWDACILLKEYFEAKAGKSIYTITGMEEEDAS